MASKVFIMSIEVRWTSYNTLSHLMVYCSVCLKSYIGHIWHIIKEKQQKCVHYAKQEIGFSKCVNEASQSKCLSQNDWDGGSINITETEGSGKGTELGEDIFQIQPSTCWTGSARKASPWKCGRGLGKAGDIHLRGHWWEWNGKGRD